jgi:hypothetical protein
MGGNFPTLQCAYYTRGGRKTATQLRQSGGVAEKETSRLPEANQTAAHQWATKKRNRPGEEEPLAGSGCFFSLVGVRKRQGNEEGSRSACHSRSRWSSLYPPAIQLATWYPVKNKGLSALCHLCIRTANAGGGQSSRLPCRKGTPKWIRKSVKRIRGSPTRLE